MPTTSLSGSPSRDAGFGVSSIFEDHMVLQRDRVNPVWGWDRPGHNVCLKVGGQIKASTKTEADGSWRMTLPSMPAGGPHELFIEGSGQRVIRDVLVGEVWLCAGQSNMQFPVARTNQGENDAAAADFPRMRLFIVEKETSRQPLRHLAGCWRICSPESAREFSAVGFFFGRKLLESLDVPIGLIDTSWGGSPIEAWTALDDVDAEPSLASHAARCREFLELSATVDGGRRAMQAWEKLRDEAFTDTHGLEQGWAEPGFNDSDWASCPVPGTFDEAVGEMDGAVWYRREVLIPPAWAGQDLDLHLGVVDDLDHSYWNGQLVGKTGTDTKDYYRHPRSYTVPGELVKAGVNLLAVRVFDEYLSGGLISVESELWIAPCNANARERIPLAGLWQVKAERTLPEKPWTQDQPQSQPEGIFNAMISPLVPFGIRGVIWYQGENNLGSAARYAVQFPLMIQAWRRRWQIGDFPFLFVQLANYSLRYQQPSGSAWAELREAQCAAFSLPNTGMVTAIDVGAGDDIHPTNKLAVGERLAATALATVYGHDIPDYTGPVPDRVEIQTGALRISYRHALRGLATVDNRSPQGFSLVGPDGRISWAQARIDGCSIILSTEGMPAPVKIKYAWADNPDVNLINKSGFPAMPFKWDLLPV